MVFVNTKAQIEAKWATRRNVVLFLGILGAYSYWGARELGYRSPAEREAMAAGAAPVSTPDDIQATPEMVARGAASFKRACSVCHGDDGVGRPGQGPRLASESYLAAATDRMLFDTIAKGRTGTVMVAWEKTMAEDEIMALVAYVRSLTPHEPATLDTAPLQGDAGEGAAIYKANCAECHGAKGEGSTEKGKAGTAIANPAFLDTASDGFLRQMIKVGKSETDMKGFDATAVPEAEKQLSTEQIDNVIAFLRSGAL